MWIFYGLSFFICLSQFVVSDENLGDVVFVSVVWRHGDRNAENFYPTDPYQLPIYWPEGFGQLTDKGKMQHYELGKFLRQRYKSLLPAKYHVNDIYIRSTDVDRVIMSAQCNMAGLYEVAPENLTLNWNPTLPWEPIPIHSVPTDEDDMIANKKYCPKWATEAAKVMTGEPFKTIQAQNTELYLKLSKYTGKAITNAADVKSLGDTLFTEVQKGYTLPSWTVGIFPEKIAALSDYSFTLNCYTPLLARLQIGNLVKDVVTHMQKKRIGVLKPDRKAWFYSGHETTVADLLQGLRIFDVHNPPYAAAVMIELRKLNGDYFVSIFYRNSTLLPPFLLTVPGCTSLCQLDKFTEVVAPIMPVDRQKECEYQDPLKIIAG